MEVGGARVEVGAGWGGQSKDLGDPPVCLPSRNF